MATLGVGGVGVTDGEVDDVSGLDGVKAVVEVGLCLAVGVATWSGRGFSASSSELDDE